MQEAAHLKVEFAIYLKQSRADWHFWHTLETDRGACLKTGSQTYEEGRNLSQIARTKHPAEIAKNIPCGAGRRKCIVHLKRMWENAAF